MLSSFSKDQIERIARSFQAHKKTMNSKHNAWMATQRQYPDLKDLSSDKRQSLLFDVENFIKEQEHKEKIAKEEMTEEKTTDNVQQVTEIKNPQSTEHKESWGIERGLPPEPEEDAEPRNIIYPKSCVDNITEDNHEPDHHSESFLDGETKYVSRTDIREGLRKEHKKEIEKRTGLKMR